MRSKRLEDILKLLIGFVALVWLNIIASTWFFRVDLTEDQRYSIKEPTKELLESLNDDVFIEVYLVGDLNAPFQRLQNAIRETLKEFRIYSNNHLKFEFVDPAQASGQRARNEFMMSLINKGITPTNIIEENEGRRRENILFPGAIVSYGGIEEGVMLLHGKQGEAAIDQSIESIEYAIASAIKKLTEVESKKVGMVRGHNELDSLDIISFTSVLQSQYLVDEVTLDEDDLDKYNALVIAQPKSRFSEKEKYLLDQYILKGGSVMLLLDMLDARMDSASMEENLAFPYNINLQDQLFQYGIRINFNLIQDNQAARTPVVIGTAGDQPQIRMMPWPFFPLINRYADHTISRNLDASFIRFGSSIDTVKAAGVVKTPLMFTSDYTRIVNSPVKVSVNDLRKNLKPEEFNQKNITVAYLLEGDFTSLYKNRFLPEGVENKEFQESGESKIIVVADGDFARNTIDPATGQPLEVGFDPYLKTKFANEDFLMNAMAYLIDDSGIIQARSREITARPLDKIKVTRERTFWQVINLVTPLILLLITGLIIYFYRKRKYTGF